MQALLTFLALFPSTNVRVHDDELRYRITNRYAALFFERKAQRVIIDNGLRLTAELETWSSQGYTFERSLVVKPVPEEHVII